MGNFNNVHAIWIAYTFKFTIDIQQHYQRLDVGLFV